LRFTNIVPYYNKYNNIQNTKYRIKDENPIIIDFPQMVSIDHPNAEFYFNRDVQCVRTFFQRKFHFDSQEWPKFNDIRRRKNLDLDLEASGFTKEMCQDLNKVGRIH
jgi:RIO kinase 2